MIKLVIALALLLPGKLLATEFPEQAAARFPAAVRKLASQCPASLVNGRRLRTAIDQAPLSRMPFRDKYYFTLDANSEQRQPLYLGPSPKEMEFKQARATPVARLPAELKHLGERQVAAVAKILKVERAEFEVWPTRNEYGRLTWVFSRYRAAKADPWRWLDVEDFAALESEDEYKSVGAPSPIFPRHRDMVKSYDTLFEDFMQMGDLYSKPMFAQCIWTDLSGTTVFDAWLPTSEMKVQDEQFTRCVDLRRHVKCIDVPMMSRLGDRPQVFTFGWIGTGVTTPDVSWVPEAKVERGSPAKFYDGLAVKKIGFDEDFEKKYRDDLLVLAGEKSTTLASGKHVTFLKKNNATAKNDLDDVVRFLEERYERLQIPTKRQSFEWRGVKQNNLIAVIPGSLPKGRNHPVVIADHFDTAFMEDVFEKSKTRTASLGADDNMSATAALLRAGEELKQFYKDRKPLHDIWLLHLTGEEFPADDLGARHFTKQVLKEKRPVGAILLMDMIGHRRQVDGKPTSVFQISPGLTKAALTQAVIAQEVAALEAPELRPEIRTREDALSYLYNTDGQIFDENGLDVLFFNEDMNRTTIVRKGYHDSLDTSKNIDFGYATAIAKTVISTANVLANAVRR